MTHFITRCKVCDTITAQCRCFSRTKPVIYEVCDDCKKELYYCKEETDKPKKDLSGL